MRIVKIFLASSSELELDRKEFEIFIGRENKKWKAVDIIFELEIWEDSLEVMTKTHKQSIYNETIKKCDIFIMLFFTKVFKYTEAEFDYAFKQFQETNKPFMFTYFKDAPITTGMLNDDFLSLLQFKKKLMNLGHFLSTYTDINELKYKFSTQLAKLYENDFSKFELSGAAESIVIIQKHNGIGDVIAGDKNVTINK